MRRKSYPLFWVMRGLIWLFYPKTAVIGTQHIPNEPVVYVANHAHMHGPIVGELYAPQKPYIWCAGEMMHLKDVPKYAYQDFWSYKPGYTQWFYKLLSYLIAPISVCIFNNARTIGVYHDTRIVSTFKKTVEKLAAGESVLIFPEHDADYNHILCAFQDKFIDVAKLYYKCTGRIVAFVPVYIAPKLRKLYVGEAVRFDPEADIRRERGRICKTLMERVTELAVKAPFHTVVPYRNITPKQYPTNIPKG